MSGALDCNPGRPGPEVHIEYSLCDSPTDTYTHVDLNTLSDWFFWGFICLMHFVIFNVDNIPCMNSPQSNIHLSIYLLSVFH